MKGTPQVDKATFFVFVILIFSTIFAFTPAHALESEEGWLFAIYISGDNDLSGVAGADLQDIMNAEIPSYLYITVLIDQNLTGDTRLFSVRSDGYEEHPLSVMEPSWGNELDMGEPNVLASFLSWSMEKSKPSRVFLVIWGHGRGWMGSALDTGMGRRSWLTIEDIDSALSQSLGTGNRIDILGFDQCNMAMASVGYELREHTDFFIFSEKEEDYRGWPYDPFISNLPRESLEPMILGETLITQFISWSRNNTEHSATLSMVSSTGLGEIARRVSDFTEMAIPAMSILSTEAHDAVYGAQRYEAPPEPVDLNDVFQRLGESLSSPLLTQMAAKTAASLQEAVVINGVYDNPRDRVRVDRASGLGVYAPVMGTGNVVVEPAYRGMKWARATGWPQFLEAINQKSSPMPPRNIFVSSGEDAIYIISSHREEAVLFLMHSEGYTSHIFSNGLACIPTNATGLLHIEAIWFHEDGQTWRSFASQTFWRGTVETYALTIALYETTNRTIYLESVSTSEKEKEVVLTVSMGEVSADQTITMLPGISHLWIPIPEGMGEGTVSVSLGNGGFSGTAYVRIKHENPKPVNTMVKGRIHQGWEAYNGEVYLFSTNNDGARRLLATTTARDGEYVFLVVLPHDSSSLTLSAGGSERDIPGINSLVVADIRIGEEGAFPWHIAALIVTLAALAVFLSRRRIYNM